jgi:hypothetical protein
MIPKDITGEEQQTQEASHGRKIYHQCREHRDQQLGLSNPRERKIYSWQVLASLYQHRHHDLEPREGRHDVRWIDEPRRIASFLKYSLLSQL